MKTLEEILRLFPTNLKRLINNYLEFKWGKLQEIRLRLNQTIEFNFNDSNEWLETYLLTEQDCQYVINQLSEHSLYRLEDELREGYITIEGGHRVGLAGEVSTQEGKVKQLQYITFFNIRIAREVKNVAKHCIEMIYEKEMFLNTLIIGAPQTGKTTLVRDIARNISEGTTKTNTHKVAIIDERSEIAASINGVPQHNLGRRTDVMDACPKVDGMMMMIRSMSPEVIIVDEIGKQEDVQALMEAIYAGVTIICTVHGHSIDSLKKRPSTKLLFDNQVFSRYIVLSKKHEQSFSMQLFDENEKMLQQNKV